MERADSPYGGLEGVEASAWDSMTQEAKRAYNWGYKTASNRASTIRAREDERRELRHLREFRRTVLAIIERNPFE